MEKHLFGNNCMQLESCLFSATGPAASPCFSFTTRFHFHGFSRCFSLHLRPSFIQIFFRLFCLFTIIWEKLFSLFFFLWLIANGSLYTSRAIWKRANCNHISKTVPWRVAHCTHAAEHNNQIIYGFNMLIMVLCKLFFSAAAITFCSQFNFQLGFVGILWFTFHFSFDKLLSHKTSIRFKPLIFFWIFSFFYAFLRRFSPFFLWSLWLVAAMFIPL